MGNVFVRWGLAFIVLARIGTAQCGTWDPAFAAPGVLGGVTALITYDDGTGSALYAGGRFVTSSGTVVHGVGKWDGSSWSVLGGGLGDPGDAAWQVDVEALVV